MEYNTNTYITIAHLDRETLGLGDLYRKNNTGDICILGYPTPDVIPAEIAAVIIQIYNHQEALALVDGAEWVQELPL